MICDVIMYVPLAVLATVMLSVLPLCFVTVEVLWFNVPYGLFWAIGDFHALMQVLERL